MKRRLPKQVRNHAKYYGRDAMWGRTTTQRSHLDLDAEIASGDGSGTNRKGSRPSLLVLSSIRPLLKRCIGLVNNSPPLKPPKSAQIEIQSSEASKTTPAFQNEGQLAPGSGYEARFTQTQAQWHQSCKGLLGRLSAKSNMIEVYGYLPAWGLPDISPYVTKLIFYLTMTKIPFDYKSQDLTKLDIDAPYGKLPYIIDTDCGTKVADTNLIISYLQNKFGSPLDKDLSRTDHAVLLAFDRLIGEHLYYSGVLEPRWRQDEGFEVYIPYIVQGAEVGPELRAFLDKFRERVLAGFNGQGMGRRDSECVLDFYKADVDALADFLADKKYFFGDTVHSIDAGLYAILRHLVDQPQKWKGTGYVEGKKNLTAYMQRMRAEYGM